MTRPDRSTLVVLVAVLLVAVLAVVWYLRSPGHLGAVAHDEALERWEAQEPRSYSFEFGECGGMCQLCRQRFTVEDGVVTDVATVEGDCEADLGDGLTMEDVFDEEAARRSSGYYESFEITYDPDWGFPASGSFRCPPDTMDCGAGFAVSAFEVLS